MVTAQVLRQAASIATQIEQLQAQLDALLSGQASIPAAPKQGAPAPSIRPKKKISPAGIARIRAAQKARWARIKDQALESTKTAGAKPAPTTGAPVKKRRISAAGLARIRAAQKARWARIKAEQAKEGK